MLFQVTFVLSLLTLHSVDPVETNQFLSESWTVSRHVQ